MSVDNTSRRRGSDSESGGKEQVQDDGSVDQRVKDRILASRENVDQTRRMVYVQGALDPQTDLSRDELNHIFATAVREYIQNTEPILRDESVQHSAEFYTRKKIAEEEIYPPESNGIDWATLAAADNPTPLMRRLGLPPDFDAPKPKLISLVGLKQVLETEEKTVSWTVVENPSAAPPNQRTRKLTRTWRPRRKVLNRAVRLTDEFLHTAGVGVETGYKEVDEQETEPF